ncbi:MAG TPA: iron-containing alcohol dehydrogenase [Methylomusa anaerophila]|uniref:Alcohol dehydrogenase YqhD n=1 Tax=Methylomusa anaerophila TaxID=1930071 RepID=A0A348AGL9_9FIRM|nr:iron-containing alcohol dehydrogenase [Methylomusa anaerophila]BBB90217.1 alcohol dehydrogenase YqhD [Methylomusa anaerophila]HML90729.1 iron-containing alcohol dehydrogenase [Methylomusa anaerophila]
MLNFNFYNPTRILFGKGRLDSIDQMIPADAHVLITYGGGSAKKYGTLDKVKSVLGNRKVQEFGGIEPNPHYETLVKAAEIVRREGIDFLLAIGGGSVIDGTKFIALAASYSGEALDLLRYGFTPIGTDTVKTAIPIGTVLTLPATGSEMNCGGVISYEQGKYPVFSELVFPRFSVLDPALTYTLPKIQVANGVIDAFVHTTEQYITYPVDGRIQDRISEGILQTLIEIGETTIAEPENYDARANLVWSATLALNGLICAGVPQDWASHMIGHELTSLYGIDHGQTLAILLPSLLEIRREQKRAKLLQYAARVWNITEGSEDDRIHSAIQKTREFFERLGVRTRLSDYNIGEDQIPVIVGQLKAHGMTALSETQDLSLDISQKILENAL